MRIASIDELDTGSSTPRWSSPRGAENDRNKKVSEIVRALVGFEMREGDIVVASGSKSKRWRET